MNREEILSMPAGREMDALVAEKVMGYLVEYDPNIIGGISTRWECRGEGKENKYILRFYSGDIFAAWEVVEKIIDVNSKVGEYDYYIVSLTNNPIDGHQEWICTIRPVGCFAPRWIGCSKTAPLAICRAALLVTLESDI